MSLDLSNKKDELKQIEGIFSQNMMNDLIRGKTYNLGKYSLSIVFKRYT